MTILPGSSVIDYLPKGDSGIKRISYGSVAGGEIDDQVGTNIRFSWLQSANSGLYLVYNEVDDRGIGALPTGREFIVKYSYIFDVFN